MATLKDERIVRKPRNVKINPDTLLKARVEALRARKPLGQWLEEAIKEKIEREQKEKIEKTCEAGLSGEWKQLMVYDCFHSKLILKIS